MSMREGDLRALHWFAMLSAVEQREWLDERIRENAERRLQECSIRGHVMQAGAELCPHCDTPYAEIEQEAEETRVEVAPMPVTQALIDAMRQHAEGKP